jgi:hypothetical protein
MHSPAGKLRQSVQAAADTIRDAAKDTSKLVLAALVIAAAALLLAGAAFLLARNRRTALPA